MIYLSETLRNGNLSLSSSHSSKVKIRVKTDKMSNSTESIHRFWEKSQFSIKDFRSYLLLLFNLPHNQLHLPHGETEQLCASQMFALQCLNIEWHRKWNKLFNKLKYTIIADTQSRLWALLGSYKTESNLESFVDYCRKATNCYLHSSCIRMRHPNKSIFMEVKWSQLRNSLNWIYQLPVFMTISAFLHIHCHLKLLNKQRQQNVKCLS